jgi:hypothetical protein
VTVASRTSDAILPAVIPAEAMTFAAHGPLAATLEDAGGMVTSGATGDVAIGSRRALSSGAHVGVVLLDAADDGLDAGSGGRAVVRVKDHLLLRGRIPLGVATLRSRGYHEARVIAWDRGQAAHVPWARRPAKLRPAERLPRRAAIIGVSKRGASRSPSVLEQALQEAGLAGSVEWPLVRSGTLVTVGDRVVHRCAIGPARSRLTRAEEALGRLDGVVPVDLLPRIVGSGTVGIGTWTAERRVPGRPASGAALDGSQRRAVIDFLAALFSAAQDPATPITDTAELVADALGGSRGERVIAAGRLAAPALDGLPGGVAHGDFWHGNVFFDGHELSGVIDWDSAAGAKLPALDLLHFHVSRRVPRGSQQWGREVVTELVEDATGDDLEAYASSIGFRLDEERRRALVLAYWINRLAYQVTTYADRVDRPVWLEQNVDLVLRALQVSVA